MKIRIAARGSKLSRIQVKMVEDELRKLGIETSFIEVKTKADLFQHSSLSQLGKGVFEKEVNQAVVDGLADIAVHSMKDMLSESPEDLELYAVLKRDPPYDVIISNSGDIFSVESGKVIGTSSVRRRNSVLFYRRDLVVRELRGNIDTRVKKLKNGEYDAIIVAEASITRMAQYDSEFRSLKYYRLEPTVMTPEANQGIIAIVGRKASPNLKEIFKPINHEKTFREAIAERTALNIIGGGCHSPLGVLVEELDEKEYKGIITYVDTRKKISVEGVYNGEPKEVGEKLGREMLKEIKNEGITTKT
ncbi:hydroxymethylbilane synthase [Stygiolobus caldivivus]|uniref:Hydroxymethylbilane synthase n=1 Tax=Stygiolobus caldivivus TaxID=2824673 RepID=A0A8D5U6U6_9CREN|nr:hydroxymethylbilane synthase [Stygiolobus caldivivus]BCU70383.1 hydroxymethylbilane synthase [Stygiolobus caldivivus]